MKLRDLRRARHLGWRDIANKGGIFASFLLVTLLSLYAWSPARQSSAFDWTSVDGTSPYIASLSGNDEIRISATPSASQTVFAQDDTLELTSTCPYGANIYLNMDSSESNSLSRTGTDEGIKTISATTGTALNDNSWGYSLDNGSTFLPMPLSTGTPVNIYNSEQVESNTEITVKYGMKIDSSIPSGYYSGNVLYSIVTNPSCAKYTLTFDTDGGTTIEDVLLTYGQTIDLPDYTTTRDDYVFDGWELIGSVSTTYDGTETDVDVNPGNALTVELKAKWVALQTTFNSIRTLQEMTPSICNAETTPIVSSTGTTYQHSDNTSLVPAAGLTDTRDGNEYVVKKLADGRCWMTENLRLINKTISSADSNLPEGETWTIPASSVSGFIAQNTNNAYLDSTYGGYYSFYTATAGTGGTNLTSGNAPSSICPKGWRLPSGGDTGEFLTLFNNYDSSALLQGDPGFVLSGYAYRGSVSEQGTYGAFWSSTTYNVNLAYLLDLYSDNVSPWLSTVKYMGYSVRCVAKEPTMQTFDKTTVTNVGDSVQLKDERDGNKYTVKKLADGNVWMTQNLRLGKDTTMTLTSADSDVTSNYQLPARITTLSSSDFSADNVSNVYIDSTYGGYYNYYTATAGTVGTSLTSGEAPASICPKGWRLPIGGDSGEFKVLYDKYKSSEALQNEPGLVISGFVGSGSVWQQDYSGNYWTSTIFNGSGAYSLKLTDSVRSAEYGGRTNGFSVRCVAR